MPTNRRALALASVAAAAAFGGASADAASVTNTYTCAWPLIGAQPAKVTVEIALPSTVVGVPTRAAPAVITFDTGGDSGNLFETINTARLRGTITTSFAIAGGNSDPQTGSFAAQIAEQPVGAAGTSTQLVATGQLPPLTFSSWGSPTVAATGVGLRLVALKANGDVVRLPGGADPDGNPDTFDLSCSLSPVGQNTVLGPISVNDLLTPTPSPTPSPTPVVDAFPPLRPYAITGNATIKTLTRGTVPLTGTANLTSLFGILRGNLSFVPTTAKLVAAGLIPVTAKIAFDTIGEFSAQRTSTSYSGYRLTQKVRIRLPSVTAFGLQLAGPGCQTRTASELVLDGPQFRDNGGTLTGSFAISDLTGCGSLGGIVSSLTAGRGNAIALQVR